MTDRALDAILDEKYFGTKRYMGGNQIFIGEGKDLCPFYSTNPGDAWKLVEKIREIGYLVTVEQVLSEGFDNNQAYHVTFTAYQLARICENMNRGLIMGIAANMPQAVASAALKAIEINAEAVKQEREKGNV